MPRLCRSTGFGCLGLLAILRYAEPAPPIFVEQQELGLHPEILPKLAHHLVAASQRTQPIRALSLLVVKSHFTALCIMSGLAKACAAQPCKSIAERYRHEL